MSAYQQQWSRIYELHRTNRISAQEMMDLARRHHDWFLHQGVFDATPLMVADLKAYADHVEQFGAVA